MRSHLLGTRTAGNGGDINAHIDDEHIDDEHTDDEHTDQDSDDDSEEVRGGR
ncbi:hypothetical protein [Terrabacter sp. BE26]|uniref:hypothetical protein n=1 Tax=Terrabacter sp. BE26 TaxID=2898152 RepID=UPI0035BE68D8